MGWNVPKEEEKPSNSWTPKESTATNPIWTPKQDIAKGDLEKQKTSQGIADSAELSRYRKSLETQTGVISSILSQSAQKTAVAGAKQVKEVGEATGEYKTKTSAAESKYQKETEESKKETQKLSKYTEGLETNYEKIAQRYRDAFDEADKLRVKEQQLAQRDYAANAALMSKAAAVGMQGMGPMTGAQQQLMMAGAQQQATMAYSSAQDRMQAMQMQRQQLGSQVVSASMAQELQNRQAGYSMDAQAIQARNMLSTQGYNAANQAASGIYQASMAQSGINYQTTMTGIEAVTNAATYAPQAAIGVENATNQYSLGMRAMREGQYQAGQQTLAAQFAPQPQGPSQLGTGLQRGIAGAGAGAAVAGPWGAVGGGVLGFASAYF